MTQGRKIGQLALFFGANDMGSLMIEENVVASAGTVHYLTLEQIKRPSARPATSRGSGSVFYQLIDSEKSEVRDQKSEKQNRSLPVLQ